MFWSISILPWVTLDTSLRWNKSLLQGGLTTTCIIVLFKVSTVVFKTNIYIVRCGYILTENDKKVVLVRQFLTKKTVIDYIIYGTYTTPHGISLHPLKMTTGIE